MISKSSFGIKPNEGFAKTFFTNDWQHSIFTGEAPSYYKNASKFLIGSQIVSSIVVLALCQSTNVSNFSPISQ